MLDLEFTEHRHGDGPLHSGTKDAKGILLELYPASERNPVDKSGIGFGSSNLETTAAAMISWGFEPGRIERQSWGVSFVVRDPDGRRVEISLQSDLELE